VWWYVRSTSSRHADDAIFVTDGSKEFFESLKLIAILDEFNNISGLKINKKEMSRLTSKLS
jgi:hypothetical protein